MFVKNLRNGTRFSKRSFHGNFNVDSLNEVSFKYKTTSDIAGMKEYQQHGDHLVQSRIMNYGNNKNNDNTVRHLNLNSEDHKREQELVNKIKSGPSHDVFFNNNQNRDSIIELKILEINGKLDSKIRGICDMLKLNHESKATDIKVLEQALLEANKKDLLFLKSNQSLGFPVEKVHKFTPDDSLFMEHEFTLLFHYKIINNQAFNLKNVATKIRLLNTELNLKQLLYIINNLTKIGRFQDVKDFLEIYFNTENIDLNSLKCINLSKEFFYKMLDYDSSASIDENKVKIEILDNLIKLYYETNDYKYLKDLIRLRERHSTIQLIDSSTLFIRIMIRIMGNYNPYYIINICNNYIQKQNIKYEPLDKLAFYKLLESMTKIDDPYLLGDFIEQWEPIIYKGSRAYQDPICIVIVERFKQTLLSPKTQPGISSGVFRGKNTLYLDTFDFSKTKIQHFKIYKHMSTLLANFENDLHYKPIRKVTDLIDKIVSNKLQLDPLAVSYFVNNILKISCNNIAGMPNLVNHLFNCNIKSYNGVDLLDFSYYLIRTEYYKNRYEIFMNFFKYKPELVYTNLSTIIDMFIKNNPSLIGEFELLLKCYRSTMTLDNSKQIRNSHNFNKNFSKHFKNNDKNSIQPSLHLTDLVSISEYNFLDIDAYKRAHYLGKIEFINYLTRFRPIILKYFANMESNKKQNEIFHNDSKFLIGIHKEMLALVDKPIIYNDLTRDFHKECIKSLFNTLLRRKIPFEQQKEAIAFYRNKFYDKFNIEMDQIIFKGKIRSLVEERYVFMKNNISKTRIAGFDTMSVGQQQIAIFKEAQNWKGKNDCDRELNEKAISIFVGHLRDIQYSISATGGRTSKITWSPNNKLNIQCFMEEVIIFLQSSNLLIAMCEVMKLYLSGFGSRKIFKNTDIKIVNSKKLDSNSEKDQEYTKTGDPYFRYIGEKPLKRIDLAIHRLVTRYDITDEHLKTYTKVSNNVAHIFRGKFKKEIKLDTDLQSSIPFNCDDLEVDLLEKRNLLLDIQATYSNTKIFFVLKLLQEFLSVREVYNKNVNKMKNIGIGRLEDILLVLNKTDGLMPKGKDDE